MELGFACQTTARWGAGYPCLTDVDIAALGVLSQGCFTPTGQGWQTWLWRIAVGAVEEQAATHLVQARILAIQDDGYRLTAEAIQRIEGMLSRCSSWHGLDSS